MKRPFWGLHRDPCGPRFSLSLLRLWDARHACEAAPVVLMVLTLFRMFSKNPPKRREENQKFVSWFWKT